MRNLILSIGVICLLCSSCQDSVFNSDDSPESMSATQKLPAGDYTLSPDDAVTVVKLFNKDNCISRAGETPEVSAISDSVGNPLMYVVSNGTGYTIVSATKKYFPVIADIPQGNFEEDVKNTGLDVLLHDYIDEIGHFLKEVPESKRAVLINQWKEYEAYSSPSRCVTRMDDFDTFILNSISLNTVLIKSITFCVRL